MKRKILSLALALCLALGLTTPALALGYGEEYTGYGSASGQLYADVPATHWASPSIQTCTERSWFNGYPDGTFRPEALIRRDEAAKVFAQALALTVEDAPALTFTDTEDNWAKAYIEATKILFPNVANLQGTTSFRPEQTITREETIYALVVAWRYASKATNADLSVLNMFSDVNSISQGVKPYMAIAVSEGLVSGLPDGTIAAQKGLTRAEFATLLARALNHGYGPDNIAAPKIELDHYDAVTTDQQVTVTGKVTPVRGTTLTLDGKTVSLDKSGAFTASLRLSLGNNTFTLEAVNLYGIKGEETVSITRTEEEAPAASQPPTPSQQPVQTQQPTPSQQPAPSQQPTPSQEPTPSQQPPQQGGDTTQPPEEDTGTPSGTVVNLEELKASNFTNRSMLCGEEAPFTKLSKTVDAFNRLSLYFTERYGGGQGRVTYKLGSKYSEINGKLDIAQKNTDQKRGVGIGFYSVDKNGEKVPLAKFFTKTTEDGRNPVDVHVDLTGVDTLYIRRLGDRDEAWPFDSTIYKSGDSEYFGYSRDAVSAEFYNVTLTVK